MIRFRKKAKASHEETNALTWADHVRTRRALDFGRRRHVRPPLNGTTFGPGYEELCPDTQRVVDAYLGTNRPL